MPWASVVTCAISTHWSEELMHHSVTFTPGRGGSSGSWTPSSSKSLKTTLGPMLPRSEGAKLGELETLGFVLPAILGALEALGPKLGTPVGSVEVLGSRVGTPVGLLDVLGLRLAVILGILEILGLFVGKSVG